MPQDFGGAEEMHTRADLTAETMLLRYWPQISAPKYIGYWTYAHDWNVILDAVERRGPRAFAGTIRMFYDDRSRVARALRERFYGGREPRVPELGELRPIVRRTAATDT